MAHMKECFDEVDEASIDFFEDIIGEVLEEEGYSDLSEAKAQRVRLLSRARERALRRIVCAHDHILKERHHKVV